MRRFADAVDRLNTAVGRAAAWLVLVVVVVQVSVVVLRYAFGFGAVWLQETVTYAHGASFMLAAGWVLLAEGHVRVDVLYGRLKPRWKALIDLVGALGLLLPFALTLGWFAVPYVMRSWAVLEGSRDAGGLPLVFLLKSAIPLFALLVGLQALSQAARAVLVLGAPDREEAR